MISNNYILALLLLAGFVALNATAEYRAYQYLIASKNVEQKNMTTIINSYNPTAMSRFYGVPINRLYLLRTWICPGNTAHKKTCLPPYQEENLQSFILGNTKEVK